VVQSPTVQNAMKKLSPLYYGVGRSGINAIDQNQ
jgi:hypothetical protein